MRVYCGTVNKTHLDKEIELFGWIKKIRKLGGLLFIDLYDKTGVVQITLDDKHPLFEKILHLSKESVVYIKGDVVLRTNPNLELSTGLYEIKLTNLEVISVAQNLPFVLDDDVNVNEEIRLKYRYLDLRRFCVKNKIRLRTKIIQIIRNFLINENFEEIETPLLCRPTPEGAKDYLVPTRNLIKKFYALPQSPQTFKQLLMIAGFDRYFQIARCFRDEPLRSDRQPEFTQVDMELSFTNENEIQTIIENLLKEVFKKVLNIDLKTPFNRMDYEVALNEYGSDKPDTRFENKITDLKKYFLNTKFKIIDDAIKNNQSVKGLIFENINATKKDIQFFEKFAKDNQAKGLMWLNINNKMVIDGSIVKILESDILNNIIKDFNLNKALILLIADTNEICNKSLGAVRLEVAKYFNLIDKKIFNFLWIINWPLFEYDNEQNRYVAAHHPFTSPTIECMNNFDKDMHKAKARSYDIVLNGYEIGGGSIRIHDQNIQKRMFEALKLSDDEIQNKFGFFLEAFKYGTPSHGGIALGLDRLLMLMFDTNSIKDVIAFPKNSTGIDMMMQSPNIVDEKDLSELNLKFNNDK